jgi:integrase
MAPPAKGTIHTHTLADGSRAFHLRVPFEGERPRVVLHEVRGCTCGCGGGWDERSARTELGNILARIRAGVWEPPQPNQPVEIEGPPDRMPSFSEYADWWLNAKLTGELGAKPIGKNSEKEHRWRLGHVNRFLGGYRLDEIDRHVCQAFKAFKLKESREIREALEAGADLRDWTGKRMRPLGPSSIRRMIGLIASILDEAIEDEHITSNPARGRRMKIHVPKPKRSFLETDELASLLTAAAEQDRLLFDPIPGDLGKTARKVAVLLHGGHRPKEIAERLGIARSTVSFHIERLGARVVGSGYAGRRVVCEILGRSGVRAGELCNIRIGHLRLHDPAGAMFQIPDSKTETGVREVQMTPSLVEAVVEHLDRLQRAGRSTGPDDFLVQTQSGGPVKRDRISRIVADAATLANEHRPARGLPPLPHFTPHSLRRTYISIALVANQFDVKWVMSQVGHADSKMTMDVYAQLEQRIDRSHGENFDRLVADAELRAGSETAEVSGG